jgi:hypothetical protein
MVFVTTQNVLWKPLAVSIGMMTVLSVMGVVP